MVIVGAGFAGLRAARELGRARARVTVVDRRNHHLFQPLLYEVATAALTGPDVAATTRSVLRRQKNTTVILAEVLDVDLNAREVVLDDGRFAYDYLIVAAGAQPNYFGHDEWARHAPALKSLADAIEIRRRILLAYEAAERIDDRARRCSWLTFAIVGGGPTGVEMAGALADVSRHTLARDFRNFDPSETKVILLEGGDRLLSAMPAELSREAQRQLRRRGVEVLTNTLVEEVTADGLIAGGKKIETHTVLWAAGVRPSSLASALGTTLERGRVRVQDDLSIPGHPEVFVVGDLMAKEQDGKDLPMLAPVAIQSGRHAAQNILRRLTDQPTRPFRYVDRGEVAVIGRSSAVGRVGAWHLRGFAAWILAWVVHIFWLIGFRNRVAVFLGWAWAYLSWRRAARVIVPESLEPLRIRPALRQEPILERTQPVQPREMYGT